MEKGFLYVATGEQYLREFEQSANSLRKHHPDAAITLVTNQPYKSVLSNLNIILFSEEFTKPYLYKIKGIAQSPYKQTFFVDTDTYFCRNCSEIFDLLHYFDLCIAPCPNDFSTVLDSKGNPVNGIYPYNTGVIAYRKNDLTKELLTKWSEAYANHFEDYIHDQPPFMEALLTTNVKILSLSSIYNVRTPYTNALIAKPVKIIHGRHKNYERIERKLNKGQNYGRIWFPRFSLVLVHRSTFLFRWYMSLNPKYKQKVKALVKPIAIKLGLQHYI